MRAEGRGEGAGIRGEIWDVGGEVKCESVRGVL